MSDDSFDPAVVALLQEIAADPRASLLRIPKERLIRWVGRPEEVVKPSGSYLTKAEKHLVAAYREEAAWVLLQGCVMELKKQPLILSELATDQVRISVAARRLTGAKELQANVRKHMRSIGGEVSLDAVQLGAMSIALAPSDHARNCLALALDRSGQVGTALHLLNVITAGKPTSAQRAQAFENMAQQMARRKSYEKAHSLSVKATEADGTKVRHEVWSFTHALQLGDEGTSLRHARLLQEHPQCSGVENIAVAIEMARRIGYWSPTKAARQIVARIRSELPMCARRVSDAFT